MLLTVALSVGAQVSRLNKTTAQVLLQDGRTLYVDFYGPNIFRIFMDPKGGILRDPAAQPEAAILVQNPRRYASIEVRGNEIVCGEVSLRVDTESGELHVQPTDITISAPVFTGKRTQISVSRGEQEYDFGGGVQNGRYAHAGKIIAIENTNNWVDGDGYLDIVESEKESELKVTRSAIGRTNMLRSVTNSLGGTFTLDYKHSTPTYGLPGGKWVMSSVTVDDGIHDDGPLMKTMFDYSDGQKDRHEREFLGFGKVITKNIDTEKGDSAVYRQAVQLYDVSTYYAQGNELGASVEDAEGNKYTETHNEYDGYYLTANGDKYTFTKQTVLCSDRASAFVPLRYTANKQYEGQASGITTSEAWNEYYLAGYQG